MKTKPWPHSWAQKWLPNNNKKVGATCKCGDCLGEKSPSPSPVAVLTGMLNGRDSSEAAVKHCRRYPDQTFVIPGEFFIHLWCEVCSVSVTLGGQLLTGVTGYCCVMAGCCAGGSCWFFREVGSHCRCSCSRHVHGHFSLSLFPACPACCPLSCCITCWG